MVLVTLCCRAASWKHSLFLLSNICLVYMFSRDNHTLPESIPKPSMLSSLPGACNGGVRRQSGTGETHGDHHVITVVGKSMRTELNGMKWMGWDGIVWDEQQP